MLEILYEQKEWLVCVKPVGLSCQAGERDSFPEQLERQLQQRGELTALYVVHRLDRDVGGVMVYAKSHTAAALLAGSVERRQMKKEYLAVVRGRPRQAEDTLRDFLWKDSRQQRARVVDPAHAGAKEASLSYRLLQTAETAEGPLSLLRVTLHSGRYHQIRAQFSSRSLPLLGDDKYGAGDPRCSVALFSCALSFPDPGSGRALHFEARPPQCFPWTLFSF